MIYNNNIPPRSGFVPAGVYWLKEVTISTIIYIDGQNFLYGISESLKSSGIITDKQDVHSLDFNYIFQLIAKEQRSFVAKYYGVAKIKRQTAFGKEIEEKSIRFADNLRKIKNCLSKQNIEYHATGNLKVRDRDECKRCGAKDYKMQEKGVDVGLAVDLVKDVLEKEVDHNRKGEKDRNNVRSFEQTNHKITHKVSQ